MVPAIASARKLARSNGVGLAKRRGAFSGRALMLNAARRDGEGMCVSGAG